LRRELLDLLGARESHKSRQAQNRARKRYR